MIKVEAMSQKLYRVKFEIFGNKMQTVVNSISKDDAKSKIHKGLKFYKIEEVSEKQQKEVAASFNSLRSDFNRLMDKFNKSF